MDNHRILYIDDEEINLINFEQTFERDYEVFTALNGEEALDLLEHAGEMSVVITDQRMPGMTGIEVLYAIKELYPDTTRMVITAYTDIEYLLDAINKGQVYHYVFKPWDETELKIAIKHAVDKYIITKRNQKLLAWLEKMNNELEERVKERTKELNKTNSLLKLSNDELRETHSSLLNKSKELELKNRKLTENIEELRNTREEIKSLQNLMPICSYCKKVRDDENYWEEVETYIQKNIRDMEFSHSICPQCYESHVKPELLAFERNQKKKNKKKPSPT